MPGSKFSGNSMNLSHRVSKLQIDGGADVNA